MDYFSDFKDPKKECKETCIFCARLERCQSIYEEGCCPLEEGE